MEEKKTICVEFIGKREPFSIQARHALLLVDAGRKKTIEDIKTAIFEGIDGAARKGFVSISIDDNTLAILQVLKAKDEVINHLKMYGYRITESEYTYNFMIWWDK